MIRLLNSLRPLDIDLPGTEELAEVENDIFERLVEQTYRKVSIHGVYIDARNLALTSILNEDPRVQGRPVVHLSRSKRMHEVNRQRTASSSALISSVVVHPVTLAYRSLYGSQDTSIFRQLSEESLHLNRRFWLDVMERPDAQSLVDVQQTLRAVADALESVLPAITPLHEEIFEAELFDLIGPMKLCGRTVWQADFEKVFAQLSEAVDLYSEYVDQAVEGVKPFLDLS